MSTQPQETIERLTAERDGALARAEKAEVELAKWKLGCETNADNYRAAVRRQDEQRLEILSLKERAEKAERAFKQESEKLTHLTTAIEPGTLPWWQAKHDDMMAKWFKAEWACADMRKKISATIQDHSAFLYITNEFSATRGHIPIRKWFTELYGTLSTTCGVGYRSPEEVRKLVAPTIEFLGELMKVTEDFLDGTSGIYTKDTQAELARLQRETGEKGEK